LKSTGGTEYLAAHARWTGSVASLGSRLESGMENMFPPILCMHEAISGIFGEHPFWGFSFGIITASHVPLINVLKIIGSVTLSLRSYHFSGSESE
jgi:hypothetical protein